MNQLVLYSTPTCGSCKSVQKYFERNNITYTKIDLSDNTELWQDLFNKTGINRVPYIQYGKKIITGFNIGELNKLMEG